MKSFLSQFTSDVISLSLAMAATVIFFDLQREGNSKKYPNLSLPEFVVYFPHMLKFVELSKLTAFINLVAWAYKQSEWNRACDQEFDVYPDFLSFTDMKQWYNDIQSNDPYVPTNDEGHRDQPWGA